MFTTLITIGIIIILWTLWGYVSSRVEQAEYAVLEQKKGYEIRLYPKHIVAQTSVTGDYRTALNTGFRIIAGYIFGGNTKKQRIAMTSPVVARGGASEKIAMTSPVMAQLSDTVQTISFGMPKSYTLDSLPEPVDPRVKLTEIPDMKYAVKKFSWLATEKRVRAFEKELIGLLERDHVEYLGMVAYAGYDAPWTPPWMRRQEVLIQIK